MKCPVCDGKGEYIRSWGSYMPCDYCNGTGEVWQTNEEWLRSLETTEELAIAIFEIGTKHCCWPFSEGSILRWLKEKHT